MCCRLRVHAEGFWDGGTGIRQKSAVQWSGVGIESMSLDVDILVIVYEDLMFVFRIFGRCRGTDAV